MLSKLLFRTLPEFYPSGSTYAHFPFMVPKAMQEAMRKNSPDMYGDYTWTRPSEGEGGLLRKMSLNAMRVREVQEKRLAAVTGFVDAHVLHTVRALSLWRRRVCADDAMQMEVLLSDREFEKWANQLSGITKELLQKKSITNGKTCYVDIVRDVLDLASARWIAEEIVSSPSES